jgi:hypothetical protein
MATRFSNTVTDDSTTDAKFRAWVQFIEDTLVTTGGWVVTADTGQMVISTVLHPTSVNQKMGYRVYRMADALQATAPVFVRFDFGGATQAACVGIWITIGMGSDGAGNITPMLFNGGASGTPTTGTFNSFLASAVNSYGSADTNRFSFGLFCHSSQNVGCGFMLERSKSSTGADTADGLLFIYNSTSASNFNSSRYIICAYGPQPGADTALSYILSNTNPCQILSPGNIGVGLVTCYKGIAQQPGMNVAIVGSADVSAEGTFSMTIYGQTRTYQQLNSSLKPFKALVASGSNDTNARVCMRYD